MRAYPVLLLVATGEDVAGTLHHPAIPPQASGALNVVLDPDEGLVDSPDLTCEFIDGALDRGETVVADAMPMPKRSSVDDFFAQLNDVQRAHLGALRELSSMPTRRRGRK